MASGRLHPLLVLGACLALAACSAGDLGAGEGDEVVASFGQGGEDPGVSPDDPGGVDVGDPAGTGRVNPALLTVNTGFSDDSVVAGEPTTVLCAVDGLPEGTPAPTTTWSLVQTPGTLLFDPTVEGDEVTFLTAGLYHASCQLASTGYTDPTPAPVTVVAGDAADVETVVDPMTLVSGESAQVTCTGWDTHQNEVINQWETVVEPAGAAPGPANGLIEMNQALTGIKEGTYDVSCLHASGMIDPTPVEISVYHGLPDKIVTTLENPVIQAGQGTTVSCHTEDKHGNVIYDLPLSIQLDEDITLEGTVVTGTKAGMFEVVCVPVGLDWSAFEIQGAKLLIEPGLPVGLNVTLQPPKPYFFLDEVFGLLVLGYDAFGNPIPDLPLEPIEIAPDEAYTLHEDLVLSFDTEGYYDVTVTSSENPTLFTTVEVAIEGTPPDLSITSPARGAELTGTKPSVTIKGTAYDAVAGITDVFVNDMPATLNDDGTWTAIMIPKWGLNVIHVETFDATGATDYLTQAFYFAELYHPTDPEPAFILDGLKQFLSPTTIDDGHHQWGDPDDMATVLEQVLLTVDKSSFTPPPKEIALGYELKISTPFMGIPKLTLAPRTGGLDLDIAFSSYSANVSLENECKVLFIDLCPDVNGSMFIDGVDVSGILWAAAWNSNLDVNLSDLGVDVGWIDVSIAGLSSVVSLLGFGAWSFLITIIVDLVIDVIVNLFSSSIEGAIASGLGGALQDTFVNLMHNMDIFEQYTTKPLLTGLGTATFTFTTNLDTLNFKPDGGRIGFGASVDSTKTVFQDVEGSISRGTCLKGYGIGLELPGTHEFEAGYRDDIANAILNAVWQTGALNGHVTLSSFPMALNQGGFFLGDQPVMGFDLDSQLLLPPILNSCDEAGSLRIQVGDMFLGGTVRTFEQPMGIGDFAAYISFEMLTTIETTDTFMGQKVGLSLGSLYAMHFHWEILPPEYAADPEPLEAFIEEIFWKGLTAQTLTPLGQFSIHGLGFADYVPGLAVAPEVEDLTRPNGNTLFQGVLP